MKKCITLLTLICVFCSLSLYATRTMSVVTWNIDDNIRHETSDVFYAISRVITHLDADVYALQELPGLQGNILNLILLRDIALPGYYLYRSNNNDGYNRQAILSRYPLRNAGEPVRDSSAEGAPKNFTRELLWGLIDTGDDIYLNTYSAHLKAGSGVADQLLRQIEAEAIAAYMRALQDETPATHIALVGDMNDDPEISGFALGILTGDPDLTLTHAEDALGQTWTWSGDTTMWRRLPPSDIGFSTRRYDHQLISPTLTSISNMVFRAHLCPTYPVAYTNDTRIASDHYPVYHLYELTGGSASDVPRILVTEADVFRSAANRTNEYVELYNNGDVAIDLKDWMIHDLEGSPNVIITTNAVVLPGDYVLIRIGDPAASDATSEGTGVLTLYMESFPSFFNTDDQVLLMDSNGFHVSGVAYNNGDANVSVTQMNNFRDMTQLVWNYTSATTPAEYNARSINYRPYPVIFRWRNPDGTYMDTNTVDDWTASHDATPGAPNPIYVPPPPPVEILITELAFWQDSTALTQNYIELYNNGEGAVDISSFIVTDLDGTDTATLSTSPAWLMPGHFALLFIGGDPVNNQTSSWPTGVLTLYGMEENIKTYDTGDQIVLTHQGQILDAVAYYVVQDVVALQHEIADLAYLCPEHWNYSPDPTNAAMFFAYSVYGSADPYTNKPPSGYGIARALWEGEPGKFYDSNLRDDWFSEPISPGDFSVNAIPEPAVLTLVTFIFIITLRLGKFHSNG